MKIVSFYRFTSISDPETLRAELQTQCERQDLLGTVLVAEEGVNGTLAGDEAALQTFFRWLEGELALAEPLDGRWTEADEAPFQRMRVRLKKEIVALGRPDIRPDQDKGTHVGPQQWNELIAKPETLIVDTRNHYEVEVGTFPNSMDPETDSFRQFQDFAEKLAETGDVLHRWHTLRKSGCVNAGTGIQRGVSATGGHSQLSGERARFRKPMERRVFRVRQTGCRRPGPGGGWLRAVSCLPAAAKQRRPGIARLP
jgi:hypothetical protein